MKQNVHKIDRILRLSLGAALLIYFFTGPSDYSVFGLLGIIPLLTGLVGFCPLYAVLGIDGCKCNRS
ncbi:MAG: DUF2892 domain-containing protein [Desulfuromonas sp.]|nr:MAG: DUF2892 domain-containing protein [Desulfuromonas sp.]